MGKGKKSYAKLLLTLVLTPGMQAACLFTPQNVTASTNLSATETRIQLSSISDFQQVDKKIKQLERYNNNIGFLFILTLILLIFQTGLFFYFYFYLYTQIKKEQKNKTDLLITLKNNLKNNSQTSSSSIVPRNEITLNIISGIYDKLRQEFQSELNILKNRLVQLEKEGRLGSNSQSKSSNIVWPALVAIYNYSPGLLKTFVKQASVTAESLNNLSTGNSQKVIFETKNGGNYWIIQEETIDYMVPKPNLKINQHNYNTVKVLFECWDYQSGKSNNFQLVKPARLTYLPGREEWQLEEVGILLFYI